MDRMLIVSADGHAGAPPETYREYLEERFHDDLELLIEDNRAWNDKAISQSRFGAETLDLIDRGDAIRGGGELGAYQLDRRLAEMDREGVAADVLIPGHQVSMMPFFGIHNRPASPELRQAGVRAYNRQLADDLAASDGRLYGISDPGPCVDMVETVAELHWIADHGFVGVAPPGQIDDPALPPLTSPAFEPFWAACAETGLVLNLHAGWGIGQVGGEVRKNAMADGEMSPEEMLERQMTADIRIDQFPRDSPIRTALTKPRRALWQLMLSGAFDRHPELRIVFTEVRADWVPATLAILDARFSDDRAGLTRKPSEYWEQHCYAAPSSPRPYELALRHEIGVDRLMFGMDYPHPEGTWPNTREWLRLVLGGVPEHEVRRFVGLNAVECYRLDGAKLERVAERIGITADEILGEGAAVDPALVRQFHARSGYSRPAEVVDSSFYADMIDEDTATLTTA